MLYAPTPLLQAVDHNEGADPIRQTLKTQAVHVELVQEQDYKDKTTKTRLQEQDLRHTLVQKSRIGQVKR